MTTFEEARFLWDKRLKIFPLAERSKAPRNGDNWREYAKHPLTMAHVRNLWGFEQKARFNIGILTGASGLVVVDADSREAARELYRRLPKTDMMTKTANGGHFFYRSPDQELGPRVKVVVQGVVADIRAGASYVVGPGSIHPTGKLYERIGEWSEPPVFDPKWIEQSVNGTRQITRGKVNRVDRYLAKIESIQGENGSSGLVRAAAVCRDNGLSESEATVALLKWNRLPVVNPPWSEGEITRAITRLYERAKA